MASNFDISDRTTWDWTETGPPPQSWADDGGYAIHQQDPRLFWQFSDGEPHTMSCPLEQHFNPLAQPGPVCDWPQNIPMADLYDWAVKKGMVRDQRTT